ncbi:hypothetical protein Tco_0815599 [Tanacetum coccineum]
MDDHPQKWHDGDRNMRTSNGNSDGITAITSKLDSLGRDMKKLKENRSRELRNVSMISLKDLFQTMLEKKLVIDMLGDPHDPMISGRPFLVTIDVRINVLHNKISLGTRDDKILFDMNGNVHHSPNLIKNVCMVETTQEEESFDLLGISKDLLSYYSPLCVEFEKYNNMYETDEINEDDFICYYDVHVPIIERKGKTKMDEVGTHT